MKEMPIKRQTIGMNCLNGRLLLQQHPDLSPRLPTVFRVWYGEMMNMLWYLHNGMIHAMSRRFCSIQKRVVCKSSVTATDRISILIRDPFSGIKTNSEPIPCIYTRAKPFG